MPISVSGYHHVRLTVTDLARSRAFYDEVFAFPVAYEMPADADDATRAQLWFLFGGVIYLLPDGTLLGLRPVAAHGDAFDPDRVGLDHVSFRVADVDALTAAATVLDGLGVTHSGVVDRGPVALLELSDPDGISLELYAVKG